MSSEELSAYVLHLRALRKPQTLTSKLQDDGAKEVKAKSASATKAKAQSIADEYLL